MLEAKAIQVEMLPSDEAQEFEEFGKLGEGEKACLRLALQKEDTVLQGRGIFRRHRPQKFSDLLPRPAQVAAVRAAPPQVPAADRGAPPASSSSSTTCWTGIVSPARRRPMASCSMHPALAVTTRSGAIRRI